MMVAMGSIITHVAVFTHTRLDLTRAMSIGPGDKVRARPRA